MSCWIEDALGVNVITSAVKLSNVTRLSYSEIFRALALANVRSFNYRYNERKHAIKFDERIFKLHLNRRYSIEQIIKAIDCLDYQSCELPKWHNSNAKKLLDDTRNVLLKKWYQSHFEHESFEDTYDAATWGIIESTPYNKPCDYSSYETIQGYTNKQVNR